MQQIQRDFFVEADDALAVKDNAALKAIIDALPQKPLLRVFEIIQPEGPLPVSAETVYRWIDMGAFTVLNASTSNKDKKRYQILRYSLVDFLRARIVPGGRDAR